MPALLLSPTGPGQRRLDSCHCSLGPARRRLRPCHGSRGFVRLRLLTCARGRAQLCQRQPRCAPKPPLSPWGDWEGVVPRPAGAGLKPLGHNPASVWPSVAEGFALFILVIAGSTQECEVVQFWTSSAPWDPPPPHPNEKHLLAAAEPRRAIPHPNSTAVDHRRQVAGGGVLPRVVTQ